MKALGVAFSARKRGNCLNCIEYAASLYCAFTERAQGIFKGYEEFKTTILNKIIGLIVIGNIPAGGDLAYHTVILDHKDCKYPPSSVLLQSAEYNKGSIYGNLLEDEKVLDRLDNLVKLILKDWKSKGENAD